MGDNGFHFIHCGNLYFNPNLLSVPQHLVARHPIQNGLSVEQYHNKVDYHYRMSAIILDRKEDYDKEATQNVYISNMDNSELILDRVDRDRKSTNTELQDKYKNGSFPHTICQIVAELSNSSSFRSPSSSPGLRPFDATPQRFSHPFPGKPGNRRLSNPRRQPP